MNKAYAAHSLVPRSRAAILISVLILACLGIQALITIFTPMGPFKATWPFVNYGMYNQAHREGDLIPNRAILGEREDGIERLITPDDLDCNNWFYQLLASAIVNHDRTVVNGFLRQGPGTREDRWLSLRVVDRPMQFRWSGPIRLPEIEVGVIQLEPGQEGGR
jgi:hypothetical protein